MSKITTEQYNQLREKLDILEEKLKNGGPGSGNFGHAGRPGQTGGSGKGTGSSKSKKTKEKSKTITELGAELEEARKKVADNKDPELEPELMFEAGEARSRLEKAKDRRKIASEIDDFAGFGGYSRRDELKIISAGLDNLTTDIKSAREVISRGSKREDRARALLRISEAEKAIREADRLLKDKDFIKGIGDAKKSLIKLAKTELKRGRDSLSAYYKQMDKE